MTIHIRKATPYDYETIATIINRTRPDLSMSAELLHSADASRDPKCLCAYFVAEQDGQIIGFTSYTQYIDMYHPQKFWVSLGVLPEHTRQGIGSALYSHLLDSLAPHNPTTLMTQFRENLTAGLRFAQQRGFVEFHRRWQSVLELNRIDLHVHDGDEPYLTEQGIRIVSVADLANDPKRDEKLWELQWLLDSDVPLAEPITKMTLEQFKQQVVNHPHFVAEGTFIAVHGDDYVGMSSFYEMGDGTLMIDLTGTLAAYRRRGIALGLKIKGIQFAQNNGYKAIRTTNDDQNDAILSLNAHLGYQRQPAQIQLKKVMA